MLNVIIATVIYVNWTAAQVECSRSAPVWQVCAAANLHSLPHSPQGPPTGGGGNPGGGGGEGDGTTNNGKGSGGQDNGNHAGQNK